MLVIEIWFLAVDQASTDRLFEQVTAAERERAARFKRTQDGERFLAARALTRATLALRLRAAPLELEFTRVCEHCGDQTHGRPRLAPTQPYASAPEGGGETLEFSLTRAGATVAVAIGTHPIGLDSEPARAGVQELLRSAVFSDDDRALLAGAAPAAVAAWILALWVGKEAVGKASGLGLADAARIRLPPSGGPGWGPATDALGRACWVSPIELPGAAATALATMDAPEPVQIRDARALLS